MKKSVLKTEVWESNMVKNRDVMKKISVKNSLAPWLKTVVL